ncbi:uncharacterized protein ACN427_014992 isoform 1-T1 [Glossina fuscipes fuscipes]
MLYWESDQIELNENDGDDFVPIVQAVQTPSSWPNLDEVSSARSRAGTIPDLDSVADMLTKMKIDGCSVAIPPASCRPGKPIVVPPNTPQGYSSAVPSRNQRIFEQSNPTTLLSPKKSVPRTSGRTTGPLPRNLLVVTNRPMGPSCSRPTSGTAMAPTPSNIISISCCCPTSRQRIATSSSYVMAPSSAHRIATSVNRPTATSSNRSSKSPFYCSNVPPQSPNSELRSLKRKEIAITAEELRQFRQNCLEEHNKRRKQHGVQPLVLEKSLCQIAQEWAEHLGEIETLEHQKHSPYGENLFHTVGTTLTAEEMLTDWYNESENYNFSKPGFTDLTNHFTQIIWKDTKFLGVGMMKTDNHTWIVCNYEPRGNIIGKFGDQVQHLRNAPSLTDEDLTEAQAKVYRDEFANACLEVHNNYRSKHGCPPLKLSAQLNKYANDWAQQLAKVGTLEHRPNDKYGQNLFMASNYDPSAEEVVKDWYSEIKGYDFKRPDFSTDTGNFTQLIWKNTRELGVGIQKIGATAYIVCHYHPQGNLIGEFRENVPPLKKELEHDLRTPSDTSIEDQQLATGGEESSKPRSGSSLSSMSFDEQCLNSHNKYRSMHGCPPLVLNDELSTYATEWAQHLARSGKFEHRSNNRYGENLFYGSGYVVTGNDPVKSWYGEINNYNFKRPGFHQTTGHFTQLIWKKTKQLGVGVAVEGRVTFVVCNYEPHGNVVDHFAENVPQLLSAFLKDEKSLLRTEHILQNLTYHICNVSVPTAQPQLKSTEIREFEEDCLRAHNKFRAMHGSPPLKLNRNLCTFAAEWAKELAKKKSFEHRPNNKYGENLYFGSGFKISAEDAVRTWYNEIHDYNFKKPVFHPDIGHFTQLIWKSSKELGVALHIANTTTYVVCNYDPPGNIMGQFDVNVPLPLSDKGAAPSSSKQAPERQGVIASSDNFVQRILDLHNEYRAKHNCPPLQLDKNLTTYAMDWAKASHLANTNTLVHRNPQEYGENIFKATGWDITAEEVMKTWYDEEKQYKYTDAKFSAMCGHFTQIVWKDSKLLGVGAAVRDKSTYVVCNYDPPGNFRNEYKQNVPPPTRTN